MVHMLSKFLGFMNLTVMSPLHSFSYVWWESGASNPLTAVMQPPPLLSPLPLFNGSWRYHPRKILELKMLVAEF